MLDRQPFGVERSGVEGQGIGRLRLIPWREQVARAHDLPGARQVGAEPVGREVGEKPVRVAGRGGVAGDALRGKCATGGLDHLVPVAAVPWVG